MALGNINGQEVRGLGSVLCRIGDTVLIHANPQVRFVLSSTGETEPTGTVEDGVVVIKVGGLSSGQGQSARVLVELAADRAIRVLYAAQLLGEGIWQLSYTFLEE